MRDFGTFEPMKDPKDYMELKDIIKMFENADSLRDRTLIYSLFFSARRISELLQLKVNDILWEEKSIMWTILKKKKDTRVLLPEHTKLIAALHKFVSDNNLIYHEDAFVFHSAIKGYYEPMSRQRVDQILRSYGEKLHIRTKGGKLPHAHCFRHSFSIWMGSQVKTTQGLIQLQQKLQHSNIRLTAYYAERFTGEMREMYDNMELPF